MEDSFKEASKFDNKIYLDAAKNIGDYLIKNRTEFWGGINWISKVPDFDGEYQISVLNYDLYDGQTGVSLFFLQLYKTTNEQKYFDVFFKIFEQLENELLSKFEFCEKNIKPISIIYTNISAFSHPISFLYLIAHCISLKIVEVKEKTLEILFIVTEDLIRESKAVDYLHGLSGILDLLLNIKCDFKNNDVFISKIDVLILIAHERLIESAIIEKDVVKWKYYDNENKVSFLGGFAHGATSIAYVLFKFSKNMNCKKSIEYAIKSLNFDRTFFDNKNLRWNDKRDLNTSIDSMAWCHGSAGIGLGRLLTTIFYEDNIINEEILLSERNILNYGIHGNQSVCHGDFGNLEILKCISNYSKINKIEVENFVNEVLFSITKDFMKGEKFYYGDASGDELIGLYLGLSGIGYQLLRFYDWENVPSILCLETPNSLNNVLHK